MRLIAIPSIAVGVVGEREWERWNRLEVEEEEGGEPEPDSERLGGKAEGVLNKRRRGRR